MLRLVVGIGGDGLPLDPLSAHSSVVGDGKSY
jgi:hypothetical protein